MATMNAITIVLGVALCFGSMRALESAQHLYAPSLERFANHLSNISGLPLLDSTHGNLAPRLEAVADKTFNVQWKRAPDPTPTPTPTPDPWGKDRDWDQVRSLDLKFVCSFDTHDDGH